MTSKQLSQAAILYQLTLYKRLNTRQNGALALVHKLAKASDSYKLSDYDKALLSKIVADNRAEIKKLEEYWRI